MSAPVSLRCLRCGTHHAPDYQGSGCARCSDGLASNLRVEYSQKDVDHWNFRQVGSAKRSMVRFSDMLPVPLDQLVTLGEGDTPLHETTGLGRHLGIRNLYVKDESRNPTHSYKDRLSAVAVSFAKHLGAPAVATASSGNAGASLAAYAARAGLPCVVASMKGASGPMVAQIRKLGAHLILMEDKTMRWPLLAEAAKRYAWFITSPYSAPVVGSTPFGIEGYKTIAYEIFEDLGRTPDWIALPVCYGDALAGIHQGFLDLERAGVADRIPRFIAAEAYGSLRQAMGSRAERVEVAHVERATLASSVAGAQSAYQALLTLRQTDGLAVQVGNDGLIEMQELIGSLEGLCFELASVMPFVAVRQLRSDGSIAADDLVVCLATSSGLKDIDKSAIDWSDIPINNQPLEQVLETARIAVRQTASRISHV